MSDTEDGLNWRQERALGVTHGGQGPCATVVQNRRQGIARALSHPQYYDGDISADLRWLLERTAELVTTAKGMLQQDRVKNATQSTDIGLATAADRLMWAIKKAEAHVHE